MSKSPERETIKTGSLRNHFLIAMPSLKDENFQNSVIYICDHSVEGAMGIIVNRPMGIPLNKVFGQLELAENEDTGNQPLLTGGPVGTERGFVLHSNEGKKWESTMCVSPEICLTASKDILVDLSEGKGPHHALVALGYSGWGNGQLEQEIAENAWLTVTADSEILFDIPFEKRGEAAAAKLGIDLTHLSSDYGNA